MVSGCWYCSKPNLKLKLDKTKLDQIQLYDTKLNLTKSDQTWPYQTKFKQLELFRNV